MSLFTQPVVRGKEAEKQWQRTLFGSSREPGLFPALGWTCCHVFPLRTEHGWRTPTSIVGAGPGEGGRGWPDWACVRRRFVVAVEVKGYDRLGRPTPFQPGQVEWLERFAGLAAGRAWVLRPTDPWDEVVAMARRPQDAPRRYGW